MAANKNSNEIKEILEDINNNLIDLTSVIDLYSINPKGLCVELQSKLIFFLA